VTGRIVDEVGNMSKKAQHKFQGKVEITYEQYFQDRCRSTVELVKALEHALGKDKTLEIVRKWAREREKSAVESIKNEMSKKPIRNFQDFKLFMKEGNKSPFWTHVLTLSSEETPNKFCDHVTECLWAKTYKEMNATDLGYILHCRPDFAMAKAYHPKIRLNRTKTLMQGDKYCNHTWYWKE
jgi:hypothetical protein